MGLFSLNMAAASTGSVQVVEETGLRTTDYKKLSMTGLPDLVVRSMQRIGLKNIQQLSSKRLSDPEFTWLHTFSFQGHSPLRSSLFIPMSGYETFRPSQEKVSRVYEFFGDLPYLYLLEFDGNEADGDVRFGPHFFLGYNDQILAYR